MKRDKWGDYTANFRQMYKPVGEFDADKREMYSYDRPAYIFWSAFMNGLQAAGYTEAEAREWLCSKAARWSLDGELGTAIENLAYEFALSKGPSYASKRECASWARETKKQQAA